MTVTALSAVVADALGDPANFRLRAHDPGRPGPAQVRIRVRAAGIGFVDVLTAAGKYQLRPPVPFVPGSEFSGVIETVGEGVAASRIGQRVCAVRFGGALAHVALVPAAAALPIPAAMSFEEAAVFQVSYLTALYALDRRAALRTGETLLVLGAAGAVGLAALQIGKAMGATVIAAASRPEKRAFVEAAGADHVVDITAADARLNLGMITGDRGVDVICDPVGGAASEVAFRSIAWGGRHLVIGFAAGEVPALRTNLALLKGAAVIGVDVRQFGQREPQQRADVVARLLELYGAGLIRPVIAGLYPLEDFAIAMSAVRDGRHCGRVVVTMDGESRR